MKRPRNKRYIISLFVTVLGLIALISGTSYAILRGSTVSVNEQVITAGSVELKLIENFDSIDNGVSVMKDTDGLLQATVYEFSVTNIGSVAAKYDLKLLNEAPSGETALDDQYIRLGLEVNGQEMGPMGLSKVANVIDSNTLSENEVIRYKLRVWLDNSKASEVESNSTKKAYLSLKVEAKQSDYTKKPIPSVVYRYGTNVVGLGDSVESVTGTKWIIKLNGEENEMLASYVYDTHADCTAFLTQNGITEGQDMSGSTYTCAEKEGTFGGFDYTEDYTTLNKTYFLGHKIGNDGKVERNDACFIRNNTLYCLKGVETANAGYDENNPAPYYQENYNTLLEAFGSNAIENNVCSVDEYSIRCSTSGLYAGADMNGSVEADVDSAGCSAGYNGYSACSEY